MVTSQIKQVKKRDGRIVSFEQSRISSAVAKAMTAVGEGNVIRDSVKISDKVVTELNKKFDGKIIPTVEEIQDIVEESLILGDLPKTAKAYILYRQERSTIREKVRQVPEKVRQLVADSKKYFRNKLGEFIYFRTYSRWMDEEGRRETWIETVDRYMSFMKENLRDRLTENEYTEIREGILRQEVMPSMRLLWSAGNAARKNHVTAYNCSFIAPNRFEDFAEIMFLSMCGTGVGFSVENQHIQQLPIVKIQTGKILATHLIEDSKEGWADSLTIGLKTWFSGKDIKFDYSALRSTGSRLKTMGGRSSGPEPLRALLDFTRAKILARQGKRLSTLDVHDICCKVGEVVVMGGVRRTALISLSDFDDEEMRHAKDGMFYINNPQRSMANNSAVYTEKPSATNFLDEWLSLAKSGTGERGIFNRGGLEYQMPQRRWKKSKAQIQKTGTNPCGEIVLRNKEFCNLTEVVARSEDTPETLLRKAKLATILGTYQSMLTDFPYISKDWQTNCNEERLLGVSITGFWDCAVLQNGEMLRKMREMTIETNKHYAKRFGIPVSMSITCNKPSGTVSQLVDSSSGIHPRHAPYYIRRVRIAATDPLFHMLREQKFPNQPEVGQMEDNATTFVIDFPVKAPPSKIFRNDLSAIEQLEYWKMVKENYTEHNPSVTVSVGDNEWVETANWLYNNWEMIGGLSFLPRSEHVYKLAPYEEVDNEKYNEVLMKTPDIDFSRIVAYEKEDETQGAKELACVGGTCEIDIQTGTLAPGA